MPLFCVVAVWFFVLFSVVSFCFMGLGGASRENLEQSTFLPAALGNALFIPLMHSHMRLVLVLLHSLFYFHSFVLFDATASTQLS